MEKTVQGWDSRSCPIIRLVVIIIIIIRLVNKKKSGWIQFNPCGVYFYIREYLERQAKAEAFKAGEEEIEEAIKAVENAGEKLKATAEDAKKSIEEKTGGSSGDAGLLPTFYLIMLLPKLMM